MNIGAMEFEKLADFAQENQIDLTIIGMDDPLVISAVIDGYMEPTKVHCLIDNGHGTHTVPADQLDSLVLVADDASDHWRALGLMDSAVFVDPDRNEDTGMRRSRDEF